MVRNSRSVSRCWTSISSTAARLMFGLSDGGRARRSRRRRPGTSRCFLWACAILSASAAGEFGHALLELVDGLLEPSNRRLGVGEEAVEQVGELRGRRQRSASADLRAVLKEDGARVSSKMVLVSG